MLHLFDDVADSSSPRAELRRLTADHDAPLSEIDAEFIRRLLEAHVWTVTNATGPLRDACLSEAAHIYNSTFMVFADWQAIGTSDAIDDTAMTALVDLRDKCKGLVEDPATAIADRILSFQILEATNRVLNEAGQTAAVFRQLDSQDEPLAGKLFAMAKPSLIAEESLALIEKYRSTPRRFDKIESVTVRPQMGTQRQQLNDSNSPHF